MDLTLPPDVASIVFTIGRAMLGALFVVGGVSHAFTSKHILPMMTARGVPSPGPVLLVGSVWQAAFGLLLALGLFVTPAAFALVLFTILATVMFLNFWDKTGPEKEALRNAALSNVAIVGGLLIAAACG